MAFLSPLFLVGTLAAAVPIVLHLLKRQPDVSVKFSAVDLLASAPVETSERRRLRELLLLALRVAALVLLALAFARPFFATPLAAGSSGVTIVALDTSLSMSAPGQFDRARARAREVIGEAASRGPLGVVLFDTAARTVAPVSADHGPALAAVAAAAPGFGASRYRVALGAANDLLRGRAGRIVVVTDLQATGWDPGDRISLPSAVKVEVADIGAMPPNLAVTAFRMEGGQLTAAVKNSGTASEAKLTLKTNATPDDGTTAVTSAETTVALSAGQAATVALPLPKARWASLTVDDARGVQGDNTRYVILDTASRPSVLVVTASGDNSREAFYIEQALVAVGGDGSAFDAEGVSGAALQSWTQARLDGHMAVVVVSTRGLEHHGRELLKTYLQSGGGLLLTAGGDIDSDAVSEILGGLASTAVAGDGTAAAARTLAPIDSRHPVLRMFSGMSSLSLVRFQRVSSIRAPRCQTLAQFSSGEPALVDCSFGEGRALIFASDLGKAWNDFPVHATFVPFMHEALQYLVRTRESSDYAIGAVPNGVRPAPGIATLADSRGRPPRPISVNVDPSEADAGRLSVEEFQSAVLHDGGEAVSAERLEAREQEEQQHLWRYALILMAAALAAESLVAARIV